MESIRQNQNHHHHHFLIVTISAQGQINPARRLARRLSRTAHTSVTIASPVSSHRLLFPSNSTEIVDVQGVNVSYASYSDGFDQGFHPDTDDVNHFMTTIALTGSQTLALLGRSLADRGRPVTCVVYTLLTDWAAAVASDVLGVPSLLFWIQPATVFSIFNHYFHGYADIIKAHRSDQSFRLDLPGLPPLELKDLPSMLTAEPADPLLDSYGNIMKVLHQNQEKKEKPTVLMNTFHALEADVIETIDHLFNVICIGPMIETDTAAAAVGKDLFERDTSEYMQWLDSKEDRSVVYISFGSLSRFSTAQMEEISKGLRESGRPYLWVVRRDVREKESLLVDSLIEEAAAGEGGMVIEWCDQVKVLAHGATGCFVTHCGWNSVTESLVCGVPTVMMPQRLDQATNAKMVEGVWGTGVRAQVNGDGVMEGKELMRCLNVVMGEEEEGMMKKRVEMWRQKAEEAVADDGPSVRSLVAFLDRM